MKSEQKIRELTLLLIQILVWFEILWAVVFLAGIVFQWSGLTDQLATAFFGSGFCAVVVLAALALLNLTANLNIISRAQEKLASGEEPENRPDYSFAKMLLVAGTLIALVVASLWFAEWRLYRNKAEEIENKISSLVGTSLLNEAFRLIKSDASAAQLADIREALASSVQTGARLSFIIPRRVKGVKLYYEFTAWCQDGDNKKISEAGLVRFIPRAPERKQWQQLTAGKITGFTVPNGDKLRTFRRVTGQGQEIILLIDTRRRLDYRKSNF